MWGLWSVGRFVLVCGLIRYWLVVVIWKLVTATWRNMVQSVMLFLVFNRISLECLEFFQGVHSHLGFFVLIELTYKFFDCCSYMCGIDSHGWLAFEFQWESTYCCFSGSREQIYMHTLVCCVASLWKWTVLFCLCSPLVWKAVDCKFFEELCGWFGSF